MGSPSSCRRESSVLGGREGRGGLPRSLGRRARRSRSTHSSSPATPRRLFSGPLILGHKRSRKGERWRLIQSSFVNSLGRLLHVVVQQLASDAPAPVRLFAPD